MRSLFPGLFFAACIALPGLARADASARVSVGTLTFTLYDLAPADGIAPSIAFAGPAGSLRAPILDEFLVLDGAETFVRLPSSTDGAPVAYDRQLSTGTLSLSGSLRIDGRDAPAATTLAASTSAGVLGHELRYRLAPDAGVTAFTLSANTAVQMSVAYGVTLSTVPWSPDAPREVATASAWLQAGLDDAPAVRRLDWVAGETEGRAAALAEDGLLTLRLDNAGAADAAGTLAFGAIVESYAVSPIPEPGAGWMLAAGLLLLGGTWRRQAACLSFLARRRRASFGSAIRGR